MAVTYLVAKNAIHLNLDGNHFTLQSSDVNFAEVRQLIKDAKLDEILEVLNRKTVAVEEYIEGSGLVLVGGVLQDLSGEQLPSVLSDRVQELKAEGFPVLSLVNFWNNLKLNPSMRSREQLYVFLEQHGHPLTEDGHFVAYRGVSPTYKDKHTGTFDNSPGSVCEMQRSDVDDDPNSTCSKGLHVAAYEYAASFSSVVVEVKVNPRDVVAVPTDSNGQKMRVCRFEVVSKCESKNKTTVYNQDYTTTTPWLGWDDDNDEDEDEDLKQEVYEWAEEFKERYQDRLMLASRIEEEINDDLSVAEILEILNNNTKEWL